MALKKELLINALQAVQIDDRENIPTAVLFTTKGVFIGHRAFEEAHDSTAVNENFKVNLGDVSPGRLEPPRFETGDGRDRSANEITKAYLEKVLDGLDSWITARRLTPATRILVAEPLALDGGDERSRDWLSNYRNRLRGVLSSQFDHVEFLPEPFAVFQYYRYGLRHPLIVTQTKHAALVVDFGGGTFDVSVVETTGTGDVSGSGRNSRPLAASSIAIGGSYINFAMARELVRRNLDRSVDKSRVDRAWKTFRDGAEGIGGYSSLADDLRQFIRNMKKVVSQVEKAKLYIVEGIADWSSLDIEYSPCPAYDVAIPRNPFAERPSLVEVRLDAHEFRRLFIERIWKDHLRNTLLNAIERARSELEGRPITVVLLSGGSANIRWLETLIRLDLQSKLAEADIIEMQASFQEVVSKGLAIECARRTYNSGTSDFKSVTYNRLCLVMGADGAPPIPVRFKRLGFASAREDSDGTLLHSAYSMESLYDKPLSWKFRLPSPPRHYLDYYFLKSTLDHEDLSSLQNVEHRVHTPPRTDFSSSLWIELTVSADGTAYPKFTYRQGRDESDTVYVNGRPFFLDMTTGESATAGEVYVGLDFGTSNSSVSYVEQSAVRVYTQRAGESGWRELNELIETLPYPAAHPLGKFLGSTVEQDRLDRFAEAFESLLHFAFAIAYVDYISKKGKRQSKIFRSWNKASAGPLWGMLKALLEQRCEGASVLSAIGKLNLPDNRIWIDDAIQSINDRKHHRSAEEFDHYRALNLVGNVVNSALGGWRFGHFQDVRRRGLSRGRSGLFRVAHGKRAPFVDLLTYEGEEDFSEMEAVLVESETGNVSRLTPFMFWTPPDGRGESSVATLDAFDGEVATFRTVEGGVTLNSAANKDLEILVERCVALMSHDSADATSLCSQARFEQRSL